MAQLENPEAAVGIKQEAAVIALVGLSHGTSHFFHLMLAALFPVFMLEFQLNFSQLGLLTTVFFVVSGLGQALSGFVVDRVGARPVLLCSMGLFAVASITVALSHSYQGLLMAASIAGLANASFHPVDFTILNQRVSHANLGHAFSVHGIAGNMGWAVAPLFFVGIASASGWRAAYWAAAAVALAVFFIMALNGKRLQTHVVLHDHEPHASRSGVVAATAFLKLPIIWWCFAFFMFSTMAFSVIQAYSGSILQLVHGVSLGVAAWALTSYMACGALGTVLGGFLAGKHWIDSDKTVAASVALAAVLLALCASTWLGVVGTMVALAGAGFMVGVGGPSRDMMIKKAAPKGATGRVYGTVYSGLDVGLAIGPVIFGALMDHAWYRSTLLGAALALLAATFVALGVGRLQQVGLRRSD